MKATKGQVRSEVETDLDLIEYYIVKATDPYAAVALIKLKWAVERIWEDVLDDSE